MICCIYSIFLEKKLVVDIKCVDVGGIVVRNVVIVGVDWMIVICCVIMLMMKVV